MAEGRDVERGKKLLIPPFLSPQQEKKEAKKKEKRVKIKAVDIEKGVVKISKELHSELDGPAEVEIVAPGGSSHEKKHIFRVVVDDKMSPGVVYMSIEDLRVLGIAENTVVTIRKR
ncbi:MAG: hypothetical protein ACK4M3_02880 [Pyrobaculum sp.]